MNATNICAPLVPGSYLAVYADHVEGDGSRCGYSDMELCEIRKCLAERALALVADDCGLVVVAIGGAKC